MRYQRVRITTPEGQERPIPGQLVHIEVDGVEWRSVVAYKVENEVHGVQTVTLTFMADVTIEHPEPRP